MKWIKRIVILLVLLLVLVAGGTYLFLDRVVKSVVESEGTEQLHVITTLDTVSIGLLHGTLDLTGMGIGSPSGFSAPQMMSIGKLAIDTGGTSNLFAKPIRIHSIVIDQTKLVVEQKGEKLNFKELIDQLPKSPDSGKTTPSTPSQTPGTKLIIDTLSITNAHVMLMSDIPGLNKPIDVTLPTMDIKNIGNADGSNNGAAIKDVVLLVINQMVSQASKSGKLPIDVSGLLSGNLSGVTDKLGGAAQKQLDGLKLPVNVGGLLNQVTGKK